MNENPLVAVHRQPEIYSPKLWDLSQFHQGGLSDITSYCLLLVPSALSTRIYVKPSSVPRHLSLSLFSRLFCISYSSHLQNSRLFSKIQSRWNLLLFSPNPKTTVGYLLNWPPQDVRILLSGYLAHNVTWFTYSLLIDQSLKSRNFIFEPVTFYGCSINVDDGKKLHRALY